MRRPRFNIHDDTTTGDETAFFIPAKEGRPARADKLTQMIIGVKEGNSGTDYLFQERIDVRIAANMEREATAFHVRDML